ncbi:hypothetical protein LCGC14_1214210 [marine sediment metagenome]|uniref:Uncharacterized protein n=1 Tax=marine sediment metagenome TaxID=412755 RepID=A0A0F9LD87_9ZZZZ
MPQPIEKQVTSTVFVLPCNVCGKEGTVGQNAVDFRCYECMKQKRDEAAKEKQLFLLGATITGFTMEDNEEFKSITVTLPDGRHFVFSHGGYDGDYYIEVDEEK